MFNYRYITPEERAAIKQAKAKEKEYFGYLKGAVKRMEPKRLDFKIKLYKEKC